MENNIAEMSMNDLRSFVLGIVDERLAEVSDPDHGLELREDLVERLLRQREAVNRGERGIPAEQVYKELGLE